MEVKTQTEQQKSKVCVLQFTASTWNFEIVCY